MSIESIEEGLDHHFMSAKDMRLLLDVAKAAKAHLAFPGYDESSGLTTGEWLGGPLDALEASE